MAVTKKAKPRKSRPRTPETKDWRAAIRRHLSKVPEVDAVYVTIEDGTVHVYSVIEEIHKTNYKRLINHETLIEKAFPETSFEFHAWPHQGRKSPEAWPSGSEQVYRR